MKKTLFIIGLTLLCGCTDTLWPPTNDTNLEIAGIEEALMEADLVRSLQLQIQAQDSIIGQLIVTVVSQQEVLEVYGKLHQGQEKLNSFQNTINQEVLTSINLILTK